MPFARWLLSLCVFLPKSAILISFYYGVVVVDVDVDEVELDVLDVDTEVLEVLVVVGGVVVVDEDVLEVLVDVP